MGAGAVVHCVCAAAPQPGQKQRIPTILQTDAGTEAPAIHCTLCRYNCTCLATTVKMYCTCRKRSSPQDGSNAKGIMCVFSVCLCAGNVLLLVVLAAPLLPTVRTYMLLSILGLELLVALPCQFYYTGIVISVIIFFNIESKINLLWDCRFTVL